MLDFTSVMDMTFIVGIIGFTKVITSIDKTRKLERLYPAIPLILAAFAALVTTVPLEWQSYGANLFKLVTASTYIYKFGKTTVLGK